MTIDASCRSGPLVPVAADLVAGLLTPSDSRVLQQKQQQADQASDQATQVQADQDYLHDGDDEEDLQAEVAKAKAEAEAARREAAEAREELAAKVAADEAAPTFATPAEAKAHKLTQS